MIGPQRGPARCVLLEANAVELTEEVLAAGAACGRATGHAHDENPALPALDAFDGQRKEIRTLPDPGRGAGRAEIAQVRPVPQVRRPIDAHLASLRPRHDHDPAPARFVPEDFGVAEVLLADVEHGIAGVSGPGAAAIQAEGQALGLQLRLHPVSRVGRDEGRPTGLREQTYVLRIHDNAAGEGHPPGYLGQSDRQMPPAHQVVADGMAPADVTPFVP